MEGQKRPITISGVLFLLALVFTPVLALLKLLHVFKLTWPGVFVVALLWAVSWLSRLVSRLKPGASS